MSLDSICRFSDFCRDLGTPAPRGGADGRGRVVPRGGFTGFNGFGFRGAFTFADFTCGADFAEALRRVEGAACGCADCECCSGAGAAGAGAWERERGAGACTVGTGASGRTVDSCAMGAWVAGA